MLFQLPETSVRPGKGEWDRSQVRNLGLAIQNRMAREFDGDAQRIRAHAVDFVTRSLGLRTRDWSENERWSLDNLALLLALTRIDRWESSDKQLAARIIRAKGSRDEALYLKLMQKHSRLRAEVIRLRF
jgi:hypothetical protein